MGPGGRARGQAPDQASFKWLLEGPGIANHPVGVVPSNAVSVPADWPLDADGTLTCLTCHSKLPAKRGARNPQLRGAGGSGEDGVEFCATCHQPSDNHHAAGMHWTAVRVAHVRPPDYRRETPANGLDAESRRCLGCHDGVSASESTNPTDTSPRGRWDMRRNHPVGVDYPEPGPGRSGASVRPSQLLPQRVRLPEGKVSCVSCHDLYGTEHRRLSVPIEESELCLACHDNK